METLDHPAASESAAKVSTVHDPFAQDRIDTACERACQSIAPAWPLDRAIAVNPHWGRISRPVREVAARLAVLADMQVLAPRAQVRQAWQAGRITQSDLEHALQTLKPAAGLTVRECIAALNARPALPRLPLLIDVLDDDPQRHTRLGWRDAITHQVSQTCAAYFDDQQGQWHPERTQGLYTFWRDTLTHDHGIGTLMGLPDLGRRLHALPETRQDAERWVLQRLGLPASVWADYLEAVLLTVQGWASWCAYLGWQARLDGGSDPHLRELLAIRLAWGAILLECKDDAATHRAFTALQAQWQHAPELLAQAEELLLPDEVWQLAWDAAYQRQLVHRLACTAGSTPPPVSPAAAGSPTRAEVQAVFCIDVRSEPMRQAIESVWPAVQTIGFAGFFGLPAAYTPLGTQARRPQLPGLLAPSIELTEAIEPGRTPQDDDGGLLASQRPHDGIAAMTAAAVSARQRSWAAAAPWSAASRWPASAFSFVEAAGAAYLGKLAGWLRPGSQARANDDLAGLPPRYRAVCRPALRNLAPADQVQLAGRVLTAMGLAAPQAPLAPLVLLVGHGSQSENNAHAAALDCGACCGQTGEANARALARLLNEPAVRTGLHDIGIDVPPDTVFVAALHNTTTDEIEPFDLDLLPESARHRWTRLQPVLDRAGDQVRRQRAPRLGLDPRADHTELLVTMRRRANDGAQTRPEWGLAGNASFIIAPRHRSQGAVLEGRSFLHEYDTTKDPDGSVLELLMTAPMLVTHWINWQYHASTCDPVRLGSGNKLLHNVVGGSVGVFEGNGGDLRIGLSQQSLHDGERWVHDPVRLTVLIDAPAVAIERVIERHAVVRQLVDNGWLHLWRFGELGLLRRNAGTWEAIGFDSC